MPLAMRSPAFYGTRRARRAARGQSRVAWRRARGEHGILRNLVILLEVRVIDAKLILEALPQLQPLDVRPWSHLVVHHVTQRPDLSASEVHRLGACG